MEGRGGNEDERRGGSNECDRVKGLLLPSDGVLGEVDCQCVLVVTSQDKAAAPWESERESSGLIVTPLLHVQ